MAKIKKKTTKQQLNPEDEIKSIAHTVADYYHAYRKQANTILTVLVLGIIVAVIFFFVKANSEKQAGRMLEAAYAALRPAAGAQPDYQRALQGFRETAKQYGNTLNGAIAQFEAGNVLAETGKHEEALKEYEALINRHSSKKLLVAQAYQRMGYAYLAMGRKEDSLKAFGLSESIIGAGAATLELARIYDREGKTEEAQKKYRELSEKLPSTTWALEARTKLPPPDLTAPKSSSTGTENK